MNDHVKGILFILLAALGFAFMSFFVKLAGNVPTMQKAFFRNIVAVLIASVSLVRYKGSLHVDKRDYLPLFLRSLFGTIGLIFNFWAISRLALPDANILNKMSPFFAVLMSIFILGERPNSMDILTVIVAQKKYRDPEYSAKQLAKDLDTNPRYLSAVINSRFGMNYSNLVNQHRVREAAHMLVDKRYTDKTMEEIGSMAGFANRQSFYAAFFKEKGEAPHQYKKRHQQK